MRIDDREISIKGNVVRTARIENEWEEDIANPILFLEKLKISKVKADIFTFWQGIPYTEPIYDYYMELDNMAVLPIRDYNYWWKQQINENSRRNIKKAKKKNVVIKITDYNDEFVQGISDIYNETPVRQGKPFWHYGKDFDTVKRANGTNLERSDFIGAFFNNELIGFIKLVYGPRTARTEQILSKIEHRDKAPTNALLAKAVEICEIKKIPYLLYAYWPSGTLADFKRHNGFEEMRIPRYYIPMSMKGGLALKLKLHHGIKGMLPENVVTRLIYLRTRWYSRKLRNFGK